MITTIKKKILINEFPFLMASFEPIKPPNALQKAIGIAIAQMIFPLETKRQIEPKLVARFTILAFADAWRKSKPSIETNANTKKLPVPGPIKPS